MRETTLPAPWREGAERAGGVGELAAALGVGRMTLWQWAAGRRQPHPIVRDAVDAWFRRRGLAAPFTGPPT